MYFWIPKTTLPILFLYDIPSLRSSVLKLRYVVYKEEGRRKAVCQGSFLILGHRVHDESEFKNLFFSIFFWYGKLSKKIFSF